MRQALLTGLGLTRRGLAGLGLAGLGLAGLALSVGGVHAAGMTALTYIDQDAGDPAYTTRILVTPNYLRMDGGEDAGDFVLLDRRARKAYNVLRDNKMIMVFARAALPLPPPSWQVQLLLDPAEAGRQGYRLQVNGVMCSAGIALPGVMADAARAMAELKAVLAATQYRVWRDAPAALQHDCDMANQVWEFERALKLGLPQSERDFSGRTRSLQKQQLKPVQPALFRLPSGMAETPAPDL